jgi:hypothetical protein
VVWQPFICHRTGLTLRGLTRELNNLPPPTKYLIVLLLNSLTAFDGHNDRQLSNFNNFCLLLAFLTARKIGKLFSFNCGIQPFSTQLVASIS